MADLSSALTNPLIAQYLSGLGADLMKYGANTDKGLQLENVNAITNQSIKTNSMNKLMQQILGPDESKMTLSNKGINLSLPVPNQTEDPKADTITPAVNATQDTRQPVVQAQPVAPVARPSRPNPFAGANGASLAGISGPEMMEMAKMYQSQLQIDQATQKQVEDELYRKNYVAPNTASQTKLNIAQTNALIPSVDVVVGDRTVKLTPKDAIAWEKLKKETTPNEVKLYEYAQKQGFTGSIVDFKNTDLTGHQKDYNAAVKGGYKGDFNGWLLEQAKAGAINLGTKVEEKKAMAGLAGQLYFKDPKWTDDIQKLGTAFDKDQAWLIPEKDRPLAKARVLVKGVKDKIEGGGGEIQNAVQSGNTMIWTVKWPSGDVETIKQNIK